MFLVDSQRVTISWTLTFVLVLIVADAHLPGTSALSRDSHLIILSIHTIFSFDGAIPNSSYLVAHTTQDNNGFGGLILSRIFSALFHPNRVLLKPSLFPNCFPRKRRDRLRMYLFHARAAHIQREYGRFCEKAIIPTYHRSIEGTVEVLLVIVSRPLNSIKPKLTSRGGRRQPNPLSPVWDRRDRGRDIGVCPLWALNQRLTVRVKVL